MANGLFTAFRNAQMGAGTPVDFDADTIKAMFIDHADDTPNTATDDFIDDILAAARIPSLASAPALGGKTIGVVGAGVFDANDTVFASLSGDQAESLILVKDTGLEATSLLVGYWDTATGLPLTPNGANVNVVWNAAGIVQF